MSKPIHYVLGIFKFCSNLSRQEPLSLESSDDSLVAEAKRVNYEEQLRLALRDDFPSPELSSDGRESLTLLDEPLKEPKRPLVQKVLKPENIIVYPALKPLEKTKSPSPPIQPEVKTTPLT